MNKWMTRAAAEEWLLRTIDRIPRWQVFYTEYWLLQRLDDTKV